MQIVDDPIAYRDACERARRDGKRVALVPTMGALHDGHGSLMRLARGRAELVAVSVFVNPTQFGPNEDYARYPRQLEADCRRAEEAGVDLVFAPEVAALYPPGEEARVRVAATAAHLCGAFRPVHFEGVCTVVTKLLVLTGPSVAVFGRKDYQQWRVLVRMAADLFLPVEIVGAPTVREPDGLAMSSRNAYLSADERARSLSIPTALGDAVRAFAAGERSAGVLRSLVRDAIARAASSVDYVEIATPDTVEPLRDDARIAGRALCAVAARFGGARLIDNVVLGEEGPPR
jgi:pantoate--beta-alanine ligase